MGIVGGADSAPLQKAMFQLLENTLYITLMSFGQKDRESSGAHRVHATYLPVWPTPSHSRIGSNCVC